MVASASANVRVDALNGKALNKERTRLARLTAKIEHQNEQRLSGIHTPDSPPNAPPRILADQPQHP